ncbi:MAG TPA: CBS domain-containing protein [Lacipirellulaceae bacterium]|nr:CBS domain-containing protein [Lacipirellulaceae bacterium]
MKTVNKRRTAADYMQRDVVTVSPDDTLKDALTLMTENHITGLPVMDSSSRCVGLITSNDILNYEQDQAFEPEERDVAEMFDPESQQWESVPYSAFRLEGLDEVAVSDVMARDLVWVHRTTPLKDVARRLIDERVHRVLVIDEDRRLYGILSAFDFVRVVAEG